MGDKMNSLVLDTINFLSKTFPKIYSKFYLDDLKKYAPIYNINKTQLRALIFIKNNGQITMTDLCSMLNIEKGSLTSMVDDLSKKGLVVRQKDLFDKRKFFINITEEGDKIASEFIEKLSIELEEKFSRLSEEDRNKYIESINNLRYILSKDELNEK